MKHSLEPGNAPWNLAGSDECFMSHLCLPFQTIFFSGSQAKNMCFLFVFALFV